MAEDLRGQGRVGRGLTDWIYVDVDGTLLIWPTKPGGATKQEVEAARRNVQALAERKPGSILPSDEHLVPRVNWALVEQINKWLKRRKGILVIWTMGGHDHARLAMNCCGFDSRWVICAAKPDLMVDDAKHDKWTARHRVIQPHEFICPDD